MCKKYLIFLDR